MNTARGALFVLYLFSMFAVAGDGGAETRHYLVEVTETSTASADITDVAREVAQAYGGRLEIYAATGFHGFALTMTPERARLLSADPRVKTVRENKALHPATEVVPLAPVTLGPYVYDAAQNVTQIGEDRYRYDAINRLQSGTAIAPGHAENIQQFTYDGFGNLQKVVTSNAPDLYIDVDQTSNHLRDLAGTPAGTGTYTWGGAYDQAGNQLQLNGGAYRYDYDALNTMVALRSSAGRRQFYLYDADGERLATIDYADASNATWRYTMRDLNGLVVRTVTNAIAGGLSTWQWKSDNIYRDSSLLASVQSNGLTSAVSHYHLDHLGSPMLITNEAHEKIARYRFWPYGGEAPGGTVDTQPMKFTGHERDSDGSISGLDYMHARFYSSLTGRFLSGDPGRDWEAADPQSWNSYAYVRNRPVVMTDPTGEVIYDQLQDAKGKEELRKQMEQKTGIGLVYKDGQLQATGQIIKDAAGKQIGSATARADLQKALAPGATFIFRQTSEPSHGMAEQQGPTTYINFARLRQVIGGNANGGTFDFAMIVFHEFLGHGVNGLHDNYSKSDPQGDTVKYENTIRTELGITNQRSEYETRRDGHSERYFIQFTNGHMWVPKPPK